MTVSSATKSEIAGWYNCHPDTLRHWLKQFNLNFGQRKLLRPVEVQQVVQALGPPRIELQNL